jgi:AMP deaminase
LREIFLKTDNRIGGRYLAELTKGLQFRLFSHLEVFNDLESSKYQMAEYRVSIYGRSKEEWTRLAAWIVDNKLFSANVRWLVQVPRLYNIYKAGNQVERFEDVLSSAFENNHTKF